MGETAEQLEEHFEELENNENKGIVGMRITYESDLSELYDFSKLDALTNRELQQIYNNNINRVMILNTHFGRGVIDTASGFLLTNNVLVTAWSYLEAALINGEYISVRDRNGNIFTFEGVITIDTTSDIALLKIANTGRSGVVLGNSSDMETEDAIISFSTKSGLGISSQAGIVISNQNELKNFLPLTNSDIGSPLLNSKGEVVGINTAKSLNTSISYASYTDVLKDLQSKFLNAENIETISFDELKEFYFLRNNQEIISNNIRRRIWNRYSRIGDIEETLHLPLIKASYSRRILSLRYDNSISSIIDTRQIIAPFINTLIEDGYTEILNTSERSIYQNKNYKVIIIDKFDYLIIVMVRL